jgi:hypothetical protein
MPTFTENGQITFPPAGGQMEPDAELYLQHGESPGPFWTTRATVATTAAPANPYLTGYGDAVPTRYMIRHANRWHRVYCRIFSNTGTLYIRTRDGRIRVTGHDHAGGQV